MLNCVFLRKLETASKVGIESPTYVEVTCGLLGKVMEKQARGPEFDSH